MNREELKALGLSDEQIDKVMASHGKVVNATKEKADSVDGLKSQIEDYKQQLADRDTQLESLKEKAAGNEDLLKQIEQLKTDNATKTTELQEKLEKQAFDFALEKAIAVVNPKTDNSAKAIKALLDIEKIKLDGGKLLNLDDQLAALKESDAHLFQEEQKPNTPQIVAGGNPQGGAGTANPFSKESWNLTEQGKLFKENPDLYNAMKAQAGK